MISRKVTLEVEQILSITSFIIKLIKFVMKHCNFGCGVVRGNKTFVNMICTFLQKISIERQF